MICKKCKKEFNEKTQKINMVKRMFKDLSCPYCNKKYFVIPKQSNDFVQLQNGQLVRKDKKIKMSKKERLRIRKGVLA